jgi:very-short-patch-repair endonuclease
MFVLVSEARALRRQSTPAERLLWHHLRRKQLGGWRFRRQHGIANYVVDFCCAEARLVVELDGGQHAREQARDARRTQALNDWGYRVLRFWNHQVLQEPEAVLGEILRMLPPLP